MTETHTKSCKIDVKKVTNLKKEKFNKNETEWLSPNSFINKDINKKFKFSFFSQE